jgi:cytochrome c-type biogenesis protein CcmI
MTLWIIFAVMTAAAVVTVLWPLGRKPAGSGGSDRLVYADQLQEIERDRAAGLIGEAEAESARIEISRRLLAAAEAEAARRRRSGRDCAACCAWPLSETWIAQRSRTIRACSIQ